MTLFLIALIIFLYLQTSKHFKYKSESTKYNRQSKSNAKKQYDLSCETIKQMGKAYREKIATLTMKEFFLDSCGKISTDCYYDEVNTLKNKDYLEYCVKYHERMWVVATTRACNLKINKDCFKVLYDEVWNEIPLKYSDDFLDLWVNKYSLFNINKNQIKTYLKTSILLKASILADKKNGNSYVAYNNKQAIDYVAQKFNLPTNNEKYQLDQSEYDSLQDLCSLYTCRKAKEDGYKHIALSMICENPTDEQKQLQYKKCSFEESIYNSMRQKNDIKNKYNL